MLTFTKNLCYIIFTFTNMLVSKAESISKEEKRKVERRKKRVKIIFCMRSVML